MGKNLKGKECGKGIYQRKDGLYHARYVDKTGRTHSRYFKTLPEARNWLADEKYEQRHGVVTEEAVVLDMTVDSWFEFWITNIVGDLTPNTRRNYRERYVRNIQPVIGRMLLTEVKPIACFQVRAVQKCVKSA